MTFPEFLKGKLYIGNAACWVVVVVVGTGEIQHLPLLSGIAAPPCSRPRGPHLSLESGENCSQHALPKNRVLIQACCCPSVRSLPLSLPLPPYLSPSQEEYGEGAAPPEHFRRERRVVVLVVDPLD